MSAEVVTIPRVYLKGAEARKSGYHTAVASVTGKLAAPGEPNETTTLTFWRGVALNVPTTLYRIFADAGIATTEPPVQPW